MISKFGLVCAGLLVLGSSALAAERKLTGPEIQTALTDHSFAGVDGGHKVEQVFQKAGATYYSVDGDQSQGFWQVRGDQYCSQWPPHDGWSCYDVLSDGNAVTFVSGSGTRYPMQRTN